MPLAIAQPIREEVVRRRQLGEGLTSIAAALGLRYRTVRGLWQRYRWRGAEGLSADYGRCGRFGIRFALSVYEAALRLRREHPRWGAQLIRLELAERFAHEPLPSERTLSRWMHDAGLRPLRGRRPQSARPQRGQKPHEVWQIDAKERLRLSDGQGCSQLSVVDEASGADLGLVPFPPLPLEPSATAGGAGGTTGAVRALGAAGEGAGG